MKPCKLCGQIKALDQFPVCRTLIDGHRNECRPCTKKYMRAWRDRNMPILREKAKAYTAIPRVREAVNARNTAWRAANKVKRMVHYRFHRALKAGLIKPQPCWVCGGVAEAHHPDYSAPLDVVWLCKSHHKQAHALIQGQRS